MNKSWQRRINGHQGNTSDIPGYEILALIGRGGMGAVFRARQLSLDRICALKVLFPGIVTSRTGLTRWRREIRTLAGLSHPNLTSAYETGTHDGLHYVAMEYVEGLNLKVILG